MVSMHPVHLITTKGILPSALIPYCSFGTNLTLLGYKHPNFTYNICSKFEPTVHDGELCYTLDVNHFKNGMKDMRLGKKSGLMLLIDTNLDKSIPMKGVNREKWLDYNRDIIDLDDEPADKKSLARIHIGSLSTFTGYGPGDYRMTGLKQMTGTSGFLAWPDEKKMCTNEKFQDCQMRQLLEKVKICECKPFELSSLIVHEKVRLDFISIQNCFQTICSLEGLDCFDSFHNNLSPCKVACEGLYADILMEHPIGKQRDTEKLALLLMEYERHKYKFVPNIQYSTQAGSRNNYSE